MQFTETHKDQYALRSENDAPGVRLPRKRILFVSAASVMGGAEVYLVRLAEILAGHAELFAVCVNADLAPRLQRIGVTAMGIPSPLGKRAQRYLKYPLVLCAALWALLRHRIQTIHISGYQSAFLLAPLRIAGRRAFITPHHLPRMGPALKMYKACARCAHCVVNVSSAVDREHRALLPWVPTVVIRNWVPQVLEQMPARAQALSKRVLFVGRLTANKGLADLIDAIRELRGEVALRVSGEGPMRGEYQRMAAGLPIEFYGYHPNLTGLYADADALVVPSHGPEGSCLAALEAMAHGLPCILSDLPVYREIADGGRCALLVPGGDAKAIAEAIRRVTADRPLGHCLSTAAFAMVQRYYSERAAALAYCEAFGIRGQSE